MIAVEAPKPRNAPKLIVVNDDGFSAFHSGRYKTVDDLRNAVLGLRDTQVAVFEWGVLGGSRVNYPSRVTELFGVNMKEFPRRGDQLAAETVAHLVRDGADTLQVVASACREAGIACYASVRMNGDYPANGGASWGESLARFFNSEFWWKHPEWRVRGPKGEDRTKLSYAFPEVREFKLAILREVAAHDVAGVNLDFERGPDFFGFEEPMVREFQERYGLAPRALSASDPRWFPLRAAIMTGFVRDVRALLDSAGKPQGRHLGLSARVDWKAYRMWGCDVEMWLKEGLLDYLVVGERGLGGYEFDLAPFVRMAKGTGCAVLFGEEAVVKGHDRTAEEDRLIAAGKMIAPSSTVLTADQYRARAARWYEAGADGVHLFNETNILVMRTLGSVESNGTKKP